MKCIIALFFVSTIAFAQNDTSLLTDNICECYAELVTYPKLSSEKKIHIYTNVFEYPCPSKVTSEWGEPFRWFIVYKFQRHLLSKYPEIIEQLKNKPRTRFYAKYSPKDNSLEMPGYSKTYMDLKKDIASNDKDYGNRYKTWIKIDDFSIPDEEEFLKYEDENVRLKSGALNLKFVEYFENGKSIDGN
ncbi:hypothetical protein [Aequorivita nionensis]|uniref:hypothetical protein n=1 Tax=Aequorivita nionensis TaxID=1287690 RepID=UPI003965B67B